MNPRKTCLCLTLALLAAVGGCTNQRPLHIVKENAEFAAQHSRYDVAKTDYEEYVRRKPDDVEVRYAYARTLIDAGEPKAAIYELNTCLDVYPLNDTYLDALCEAMYKAGEREALTALLARNASERGRVSDFLRQGIYAAKIGNADEAQQALKTAAKLDGGKTVAPQRALADFYGSLGDRPKQVRHLRMAYFIEPANPDTLKEVRRIGEIPGPSFALAPDDVVLTAEPVKD
ncbi:MAG TPA: tetratricopeptide repeat protein [Phycisphaerales bacterium]|nr:tetratricopeptide repeat protein [Phycisphaerales bacterium]